MHPDLWDFLRGFETYSLQVGGVCKASLGPHTYYMVTDPEESLTLSNTCLSKVYIYRFSKDFIGKGLVSSEASLWKSKRKLLNPSFSQQVLNTYVYDMNVQARSLVSQLASKVGKDPFDVRKYFMNYTLSTVTRTTLGLNNEDHTAIDTDYAEAIDDLMMLYSDRTHKVWLHLSYLYKWSSLHTREYKLLDKLKNVINPVSLFI